MTELVTIKITNLDKYEVKVKKAQYLIDQLKEAIADINKTELIYETKPA